MHKDEILTEVWRIRDDYVNLHHNNLSEILADLQQRQKSPNSRIVDLRDQTSGSTESFLR